MPDESTRVAVVTGGSRGIGRAIAIALAADGIKIIVNYSAQEAAAATTVAAIEAAGGRARAVRFDVSDAAAVDAAFKDIAAAENGLHILVNNAGVAVDALTLGAKDADWQRGIALNLHGAFHCTRAALRGLMRARDRGRIINITSVVAEMGSAGQAPYVAAKAGLIGLTKTWAREYASRGITSNAVSPGYIETDMTAALSAERKNSIAAAIPLGRVGKPEDVAAAVAYLASPQAAYVTGQVIRVNGGLLM
jgi:3-oxoacyl-[acyl-carrier protein] reductase